jgi:type IV pilus assembly protein PilY1
MTMMTRAPQSLFLRHGWLKALLKACICLAWPLAAQAQLNLITEPVKGGLSEPAPNVILTLDNGAFDLTRNNEGHTGGVDLANYYIHDVGRSYLEQFWTAFNKIPDNKIRFAWQFTYDINRDGRPAHLQDDHTWIGPGASNSLKLFGGQHRQNFARSAQLMPSLGHLDRYPNRPLREMMARVYNYMSSPQSINSPFASEPGVKELPYSSCRRSYHILIANGPYDSGYGGVGNVDGRWHTLPDGTVYAPGTDQTRLYADGSGEFGYQVCFRRRCNWEHANPGTLADWAFLNWATDFQPKIPNHIPPKMPVTKPEQIGHTLIQPYWNSKNNPMTWQGVTQYTVEFWRTPVNHGPSLPGDYASLVNWGGYGDPYMQIGKDWWLKGYLDSFRATDVAHAAYNGRGKFFRYGGRYMPPNSSLTEILDQIFSEIVPGGDVWTARGGTSTDLKVGMKGLAFVSGIDADTGDSSLQAMHIDAQGKVGSTAWDAAATLNSRDLAYNPRTLLTSNGQTGLPFEWSKLTVDMKDDLKAGSSDTELQLQQRLRFVAGDRSQEQPKGSLRTRNTLLGSLVNSSPVLMGSATLALQQDATRSAFIKESAKRTPALFIGANDGMLHAFSATATGAGKELFAYVPRGVYGKLRAYSEPGLRHQFMVDGTPMVAEANLDNNWRSVLVGTLGLGGRGYFALDVTQPERMSVNSVLFDRSRPGITGDDAFIGHMASPPAQDPLNNNRSAQIVQLNNGRWAAVMGNGVNSPSGQAVLLIQYLDGEKELLTLATDSSLIANGLSSPRLVDLDHNGTADIAYAGDIKGNLWSFHLGSQKSSDWKVRFGSKPLLSATSASQVAQPITTAPLVLRVPKSQHLQIAFGTGRLLDTNDSANTATQSLYSVRDTLRFEASSSGAITLDDPSVVARSDLVEQTTGAFDAQGYAISSANTVPYTGINPKRGWWMDLKEAGERQLANAELSHGSLGQFKTYVPPIQMASGQCGDMATPPRAFLTYVDLFNGTPDAQPAFLGLQAANISRVSAQGAVELKVKSYAGTKVLQCKSLNCAQAENARSLTLAQRTPSARVLDWRRLQ